MAGLQVNRWRRFGKDRFYVNDGTGASLGWMDGHTGAVHILDPARAPEVEEALAPHRATLRWPEDAPALSSPPAPTVLPPAGPAVHVPVLRPAPPTLQDLAANRPGEHASRRAALERERAPFRSFFGRLFGVHTEERHWRVGAAGERMVAAHLARLERRGWRVLHSVPVGSGSADIDHVAIGPGGVFTLNTKHHPGNRVWVGGEVAMVNGLRLPYVRNSRHEARRASRLLGAATGRTVPATGLIVVAAARLTVRRQPGDGVLVVGRREVARVLRRMPRTLTEDQVEALYQAARRPETWRT
jgi:hypothetical protein